MRRHEGEGKAKENERERRRLRVVGVGKEVWREYYTVKSFGIILFSRVFATFQS